MAFLERLFGSESSRTLKEIEPVVADINDLEPSLKGLSDADLSAKTDAFRKRLADGEELDALLPEAFAVVREASRRTLGERHYDVQLMGGIILHRGGIAEMRTGEGKTLVATLPVYLNALSGKGVHVVTVNDYLSRRDAVWMGQVYAMLGLSVGVINNNASYVYDPKHLPDRQAGRDLDKTRDELGSFKVVHEFLRPATRREAYAADITYGTNNEFGFDYLRDNIARSEPDLVQRGFHYAIVDEIDSILIDEARTPLIISAEAGESEKLYHTFARIAGSLKKDEDYTVDEKFKSILLTDHGIEHAERLLGVSNIYTEKGVKYVHHLETAIRAKALYTKDKDYVVKEGEIVIVDEFTGRLQPGRRWSEGLHQAIEAKEGVEVQKESRTYASITFQNYFRAYTKLAGMTGTALTSAEEFHKVYRLTVVAVPTHREPKRIDKNDLIFQTEKGKIAALVRHVKALNQKGQPVLIGTASIEKNELLSAHFKREGIPHEVLNAKNHEREGEIIAQAGRKGSVVVATNMAGRGVDIKLGGMPTSLEAHDEVKALGGLCVLGTERHEARRIDNQLRGRSGRQGDPGETQFFVSLEDTLMRVFAADTVKNMMGRLGIPEDEPIENALVSKALESAQAKIEGFNFDARKHVLEYDDVLNQQRESVYERRRKILLADRAFLESLVGEITEGNDEVAAMVEGKRKLLSEDTFFQFFRQAALQVTDLLWVDHLEAMEYMRSSVNLRAYGQRDPLVEYKKEGLRLFRDMQRAFVDELLSIVAAVGQGAERLAVSAEPPLPEIAMGNVPLSSNPEGVVGRNDPCPCGSGKKYKKCHGK